MLGLAQSTVSMALNGSPRVSKEVREKVKSVSQKLGYFPNYNAASLSARKTDVISVLTHGIRLVEIRSQWVTSLQAAVHRYGYKFRLDPLEEFEAIAGERSADGFIAFGSPDDISGNILNAIRGAKRPVVFTDCGCIDNKNNMVAIDNKGGAAAAVDHLYQLGHRSICFFGYYRNSGVCAERYRGYRERLCELSLEHKPAFTIEFDNWHYDAQYLIGQMPKLRNAIEEGASAVVASRDAEAAIAIRTIKGMGLSVPQDVSVIGFDDTNLSEFWDPPITVIDQNLQVAADSAVRMLLSIIKTGLPCCSVSIPTILNVKGSTGIYIVGGSRR